MCKNYFDRTLTAMLARKVYGTNTKHLSKTVARTVTINANFSYTVSYRADWL